LGLLKKKEQRGRANQQQRKTAKVKNEGQKRFLALRLAVEGQRQEQQRPSIVERP
jgi:hypothetical protein